MEVKPVRSGWYNAFRPWTLHGAVVPVVLGACVGFHDRSPDALAVAIFALVLVGAVLLQSAANLFNTYGDFKEGLDTLENHSRSPELVDGTLMPEQVKRMGIACLCATAAIGLVLIWYCGWGILWFGLAGIVGAAGYTVGPAYKYYGVGQLSCFLMMGVLEPTGTYYVLTGTVTWEIFLLGLPNAFLITAVLAGNEMRDFRSDREGGIRTLSIRLGYDGGMALYRFECVVPYLIAAALIGTGTIPWTCGLILLSLHMLYVTMRNSQEASSDGHASFMMVPLTFKLNWVFGALLAIGYIIGVLWAVRWKAGR